MLKRAEKYDELLALLKYRPHPVRLLVLRTLCEFTEFTDLENLVERMTASGMSPEREKVRMILRRLNESGFLERRNVTGKNKWLFRLKEYIQLEQEILNSINSKHQ